MGKKSIAFTNKLSVALKALEVHVTAAEEKSENITISEKGTPVNDMATRVVESLRQSHTEELLQMIRRFQDSQRNRGDDE